MAANSDDENIIQTTPVFKSLLMPDLLMGGEKFLIAPLVAIVLMLLIYGQSWIAVIFSLVLFFTFLPIIRTMARKDAQLMGVYQRSRKQQNFYDANTSYHLNATYGRTYNIKPKE